MANNWLTYEKENLRTNFGITMGSTIKSELNILVPKELATNLDFWFMIRDNIRAGSFFVPSSFLHYLSGKYGYAVETLKQMDYQKHIMDIAIALHNTGSPSGVSPVMNSYYGDATKITKIPELQHLNESYYLPVKVYESKREGRKRLLVETPIAEFD
jgi:hypothetical protein